MKKLLIFHAVTALVTATLLTTPIVRTLFSTVDGFAPPRFLFVGRFQYLLAAFIFYGFSFVLLRLVPPPKLWSVAYTASSWLFFLWAFYPILNNVGMMRRIAVPMGEYLDAERLREQWHIGGIFVFAFIQLLYLLYVLRRVRKISL